MKKEDTILILGGDNRQKILDELLEGTAVKTVYLNSGSEKELLSKIKSSKVVVFPIPITKDKKNIYSDNNGFRIDKSKVMMSLSDGYVVFGGGFSKEDRAYMDEEGIEHHDFLLNEEFQLKNAYLTAEGALRLLLENTTETLFNKKVLVTGYGRISEFLCDILYKMHMKVYTAARNEIQLKQAEMKGYVPVVLSSLKDLRQYDFIFNTIPVRIFDEKLLSTAEKCTYFELASSPFGAEKELVLQKGISYVSGSSLPGRFFPVSSAVIMKEYILKYL